MNMDISKEYNVYGEPYNSKDKFILIGFKKYNSDDKIDIVNFGISMITKSKYVHVELIYLENNKLMMMSASQYSNSVRKREHKLNKSWDYYRYKVNEEFLNNMFNFFKIVEHDKYDYAGILGFILFNQDRSDRWFCSEFSSNIFKINGFVPMWCIEPSSVSPGKFGDMFNMDNKINRLELIKEIFTM